ncbi:MAG TPA: DUF1707 domain-containing protein [Solirubrobacteraceae bacterium]|jgi:hypothetical protein|nr:DUF1707 domain-containing protein [Solirubrobacteraceae bacterium]
MNAPSHLRVADADREQLIDELREHMIDGRLTPAEFEERLESAYRATTHADIEALKADLPISPSSVRRALSKRKARLRRRLVQETGGSMGVSALCVGIWLATGASADFWPAWVIGFTMLPVVRDGWRLLGPASDVEVVEARMRARRERELAAIRAHGRRRGRYRRLPR